MDAGVVIILHQKNLHRYRFPDELPWASLKRLICVVAQFNKGMTILCIKRLVSEPFNSH